MKIRYLVTKPGALGIRHYWQPSTELRQAGYKVARLSDDPIEAAKEAEALNAKLDNARRSGSVDIRTTATPTSVTWLYVLSDGRGVHKLGISRQPDKRLKGITTGCPTTPQMVFIMSMTNVDIAKIECLALRKLRPFRTKGEWVAAPLSVICRAIHEALDQLLAEQTLI